MSRRLYIDAGVLVNLCAADQVNAILAAQPYPLLVLDRMLDEPLALLGLSPLGRVTLREAAAVLGVSACPQMPVANAALLVEFALVVRHDPTAAFLAMIAEAEDGLATDDPCKALALAQEAPDIEMLTTAQLLWNWQQQQQPPDALVAATLHAIEERARFSPTGAVAAAKWWRQITGA